MSDLVTGGAEVRATDPTVGTDPPAARPVGSALTPGTLLGGYRIVDHIGRGGMGDVYRARDVSLDRDVALKTIVGLLGSDATFVERFREEAKAAARLSHPNLVQVHAFGEHEGTLFFAMELVPGKSLGDRLKSGPLPWREAARFAAQAARGLDAAWQKGIVHRDVKPENLLVGAEGTVKVADFGLAKRLESNGAHTATGIIVGTPRYMSPEQAQGETLDFRSDMYSLGATVFHLVAGRPVFDGATAMKLCMKHIQEPPPALATVAPDVPEALSNVVARMLAKRPQDRYESYAALAQDLEGIAAGSASSATLLSSPAPGLSPPVPGVPSPAPGLSPGIGSPAPFPAAPTPGSGTLRPIVQIVKRPDGALEVGLNCPLGTSLDERRKQSRAAAPLAPRGRRLLSDFVDLTVPIILFELTRLVPLPGTPFTQVIAAFWLALGWVQVTARKGGTIGERLAEVRLVGRTGGYPAAREVGLGWLLAKGLPFILFTCVASYISHDWGLEAIGGLSRVLWCCAGLLLASFVEHASALATGRSLRDRIFKTRVVDVRGLAEEESED
jgi:serine/threonine protein kinase